MKKIEILALVADEPKVTEAVGEMGVLHLTRAPVEGGALPVEGQESQENDARLETLQARAADLCSALGIEDKQPPDDIPHPPIQQTQNDLDRIEADIADITAQRNALAGSRRQIEKLLRDVSMLRDIDAPVEQLESLSFLHFAVGDLTPTAADTVQEQLGDKAVLLPYKTPYGDHKAVAIASKKSRWALESALQEHGFKRDALPADERGVPSRIAQLAEQRFEQLLQQIKQNNRAVHQAAQQFGPSLLAIRRRLRTEHAILKARANFAHTWATMLITGWIPADNVNALCETVLALTDHRAIIEIHDPSDDQDQPPTLLKNHPLIRPFEMLVSAYSTPQYNEIDPTPFLAVLFLIMFGLMFGDVGHSGILLLAGIAVWWKAAQRWRDFGKVLTGCGLFGVAFGVLYGSLFGLEKIGGRHFGLLPPLQNAQKLLALTVLFGVAVISLGIILNIINRFRRKDYAHGWFDKFGITGAVFYWGSVAIAIRSITTKQPVSWVAVVLLIIVPLLILFSYRPVQALLRKRRSHQPPQNENLPVLLFESAVEAFDAVLLYMANTLSFARIAAFALAHAGLSFAIFEVMRVVRAYPGGPVWAAAVFVAGTLAILLLEGLIVAIQSMRLEYYEFFGKFFQGEGRQYRPFSLKGK